MSTGWVNVKVRFHDERRWYFLSNGGRVSRLRIHASPIDNEAQARFIATELLKDENVAAARVDVDGRTVARFGEPTPPRPVYGPAAGFRYLVGARKGAGVFHVVDGDRWGNVSAEVYNACHDEAARAGLATNPLTIHGCTATISTHGLRFVQRADNPVGAR